MPRVNTLTLKGASTANAALTVTSTLIPPADQRFRVAAIAASYNAAPTGGNVQVGGWDGSTFTSVFDYDLIGTQPFTYAPEGGLDFRLPAGQAVRAILAAAGAAVVGKINVLYYLEGSF